MNSSAPDMPIEVEAKLLVPHERDLRGIAALDRLGAYTLCPRGMVRLHSLYLDTPVLTLARHGVALRVRRAGGRWEATAKWAGQSDGPVHERPELTVPLPAAPQMPFTLPDGPLRLHLSALVAGRALAPILITKIQRRRFDVVPHTTAGDEAPQPVAELALDRIRLEAPHTDGGAVTTYCEVEIESKHGTRSEIAELAQRLQDEFGLAPSTGSKFVRGMTLLYGSTFFDANQPTPVLATDTVEAAARKIVAEQLRRLRANDPGTRLGQNPEALHDYRVAVRRLRAATRVFAAGIPQRLGTHLAEELSWLGSCSGAVRDLDVHLAKLAEYCGALPENEREGLARFAEHLRAERVRCRTELLALLDSRRYCRLLLGLERFASAAPRRRARVAAAREPFVAAGRRTLKRAVKRLLKEGHPIGDVPSVEALHALRIRAKRLRYLLEFVREITGKPSRRLVRRLIQLQDLLGAHHDAVVAADVVRRYAEGPGADADPATLVDLGVLIGHHRQLAEAARAGFRKTWHRFSRKQIDKELQAVLGRLSTPGEVS